MKALRSALHGFLLVVLAVSTGAAWAQAQDYPSKPIRIVTPFPPGGSTDVLARMIADGFTQAWSRPAIVDSRPGGNTLIAAENVARSAPDGHTLFITIDFTLALTKALYAKLAFDPDRDFSYISLLVTQPLLIITNPKSVSASSLQELIRYSKANPGKLNVGLGAIVSQLVYEQMKTVAGLNAELISYRGSVPTTAAVLAGDVQSAVDAPFTHIPHIKDGRLTGLAVTARSRMPSLPQVPTVFEAGIPQLEIYSWFGLVAPADTPMPVINKLNQEVRKILARAEVKARLADFALDTSPSSPEEFAGAVKAFSDKWVPVVKRAGIKFD